MTTKRRQQWDKGDVDLVTPVERVDRLEILRGRFWTWAAILSEGKWLEANGWIRVRDGWLLPDWHPHLRKFWGAKTPNFASPVRGPWFETVRSAIPQLNEPYDQNHAANSQRAHTNRRTVPLRHARGQKAPAFPPYIKGWSTLPFVQSLMLLFISLQFVVGDHWVRHLFFLAAVLLFCVSFCVSHVSRREWELDWAETQLNRRTDGVHGPN